VIGICVETVKAMIDFSAKKEVELKEVIYNSEVQHLRLAASLIMSCKNRYSLETIFYAHCLLIMELIKSKEVRLMTEEDIESFIVCNWKNYIENKSFYMKTPQYYLPLIKEEFASNKSYGYSKIANIILLLEPTIGINLPQEFKQQLNLLSRKAY